MKLSMRSIEPDPSHWVSALGDLLHEQPGEIQGQSDSQTNLRPENRFGPIFD